VPLPREQAAHDRVTCPIGKKTSRAQPALIRVPVGYNNDGDLITPPTDCTVSSVTLDKLADTGKLIKGSTTIGNKTEEFKLTVLSKDYDSAYTFCNRVRLACTAASPQQKIPRASIKISRVVPFQSATS